MKYQIIIVLLSITNSVFSKYSKHFGYWDEENDSEMDFGWLLDNEDPENNEVEPKKPKICKTNECEILGKEFLKGMNTSVNPCDDFYDFVCGAWKSNKIPGYTPVWSRPFMFQQTVFRRIQGILEVKPKRSDILPVKQAKKWYRACMNIDALESRGIKPLESILMQLGGWPMTIDAEEWDENGHSWQRIEQHYFHLTGSYIFIDIIPSRWNDGLKVQSGKLPLFAKIPFEFRNYTANKYDEYVELIENIVRMFIEHNSANVSEKTLKKDVEDLVNFEKELYKLNHHDDDIDDYNYRDYETIDEFIEGYEDAVDSVLETETVKINFRKLIKSKFDLINMDVNSTISTGAKGYSYYTNLTELFNITPKRTIVNYLHWFFVSDMLIYTTEKMRNQFFKYIKQEFGVTEREPRWLECTKEVKMEVAESYAFVTKYFSEDVEQNAREVIKNIQNEMRSQISTSNWMDQETKDIAIEKLDSMKVLLGFPDWFKNKTIILNYYKGLIIGYDHFDNVLSFQKYSVKLKWSTTFIKMTSVDLELDVREVNAFYSPYENYIVLPAADFQPPLFTPQLPSVVNYGSVGSVIGHEIGHGFDVNGIQYGIGENHTEISKQIMEMYYKRAECFLDQFNNYYGVTEADYEDTTPDYFEGSKGRRTRGENMADTTGLHSVVKAYQNMRAKNPDVISKLPGFEKYTDDQMFFISFGSLWCEKVTPKFNEMRSKYDVHSPSRLRVIGAVSNTNDFAKAFNCPKGSPMNPENKCNIWKYKSSTEAEKVKKNSYHPWVFSW